MTLNKELSNVSYTNKDFNSIYSELLEYAKKLSYRWDPSSSDESDPGVVLLKLAAIIGDKNNYNIDKNVLELMPNSVTQLCCARQLFEQCGYIMRYYRSAEGYINITLNSHLEEVSDIYKDSIYVYTIPRFTMFSNIDNDSVYTSVRDINIQYQENGVNKSVSEAIPVVEGIANQYKIHNDSLITVANLDSNNRLYFTEVDIPENGIFITNVNEDTYDKWYRVDTLETEDKGQYCYKFGVSLDGSLCYIQFPDDAELLFGEGINITYLRTKGVNGNIIPRAIKQFYTETSFKRVTIDGQDESVVAASASDDNSGPITIINELPITNGKDPETIDEAYKSYKRVKNTFDTLITVKDYTDYMITSENASNGFVCDRTNDIQHSYRIKQTTNSGSKFKQFVETSDAIPSIGNTQNSEQKPNMTAFDLCIYSLQYVPDIEDNVSYNNSFSLTSGSSYIEDLRTLDIKSLQHDFVEFFDYKILMIKNRYPITCTIVPRYELTLTEIFQLRNNVETALYNKLNSKNIDFGSPITFDMLETTILSADDRIKHIEGLSSPTYSTWVVYQDNNKKINEMRIDSDSLSAGYVLEKITASAFEKEKGKFYCYDYNLKTMVQQSDSSTFDKSKSYYSFNENLDQLWDKFRAEIFAKNILCGITSLYSEDRTFSYSVLQSDLKIYENVDRVTTNTCIKLEQDPNDTTKFSGLIEDNESILLTAPNFVQENNFSSYVKILYSFNHIPSDQTGIPADSTYIFGDNDFIMFFWKESDAQVEYNYIKYTSDKSSPACAISPSFTLTAKQEGISNYEQVISHFSKLACGKGKTRSVCISETTQSETDFVKSLTSTKYKHVLTGTEIIKTLRVNTIHINNATNGSMYMYWILNSITYDSTGSSTYRLFDEDEFEYTLKSGEYFFYSNNSKTTLYLLGEGTVIRRSSDWENDIDAVWQVPTLTYPEIISNGIEVLEDYWKKIALSTDSDKKSVIATEMQQYLLGPKNTLILTSLTNDVTSVSLENEEQELNNFEISYRDEQENLVIIDKIISEDYCWSARTILNLDMSYNKPQRITSRQKITLYPEEEHKVDITVDDGQEYKYLLCSNTVEQLGGVNVDITPMQDRTYDIMSYNIQNISDEKLKYSDTNFSVIKTLDNLDPTEEYDLNHEFELLPGKYLLHISSNNPLDNLIVTKNNESDKYYSIESLLNKDDSDKTQNGIYKIIVNDDNSDSNTSKTISIKITVKSSEEDSVDLTFNPIVSYSSEELEKIAFITYENKSKKSFEAVLLDTLSNLDRNVLCEYTNIIKDGITNPLQAKTFLQSGHFYNKYTICQWTTENSIESDLVVSSGIR